MIDEWKKGAEYWTKSWNPILGCRPVSEGCERCYAARMAMKFPDLRDESGGFTPHAPKRPKNPPAAGIVFCGNMTDLFGEWVNNAQITAWIESLSKDAVNLILTKRADRLGAWFFDEFYPLHREMGPHIYVGVTAENQEALDQRYPTIYQMPAKRWLSCEPLLGPLDFFEAIIDVDEFADPRRIGADWVVVGAESGPNERPCKLEWIESIVVQCQAARVPVYVKQIHLGGKLVKDITKFPPHLQIRQVPWEGEHTK